MPFARKTAKASSYKRKAYPKRKSVRSTVMQRAKTLEYSADPVPPVYPTPRSNKEQKFLDMPITTLVCNKDPLPVDVTLLNQIGQGTSVNTRIGMRYQLTGVHIRGYVDQQGPQNTEPCIGGYYVVYDSEPHGTKADVNEMFNIRSNDMAFAFPNGSEGQKGGRFKYIKRHQVFLGNLGSGTSPVPMDGSIPGRKEINDYIPLNKLAVQCMRLNAGSTITSIQKGALLLVPYGRNGAVVSGTAQSPALSVTWRLYFNEVN